MATYVKFEQFVEDLGMGVHDLENDVLKVYLSDATPSVSADAVKADLAEISTENGYTGAIDVSATFSQTSGTATLAGTDVVVTATGTVGPFRYVVLFNDTATGDPLIAYWDIGSEVTLDASDTFTVDFGAAIATVA